MESPDLLNIWKRINLIFRESKPGLHYKKSIKARETKAVLES